MEGWDCSKDWWNSGHWKTLQVSATVVSHYLLVTDSSVQPRAGAMRWFLREPGGILGHNQYKMCWVAAMLRSIHLDRMVCDGINNTWEKHCKSLREEKIWRMPREGVEVSVEIVIQRRPVLSCCWWGNTHAQVCPHVNVCIETHTKTCMHI